MYLNVNDKIERTVKERNRTRGSADIYGSKNTGWFRYIRLVGETIFRTSRGKIGHYCIVIMQRGAATISQEGHGGLQLCGGYMTVIDKNADILIETDKGCEFLLCVTEGFPNMTIERMYSKLLPLNVDIKYTTTTVKTSFLLTRFADHVREGMENGVLDSHLSHIKEQEMFLLICKVYTRDQLLNLMWPLLVNLSHFTSFVINNYHKVGSVAELIKLSPYGQTQFKIKFRQEFGMSAQQWMLRQKAVNVRRHLADPKMYITDIIAVCGFNSPSELTRFCKKYLGDTPSRLMTHLRNV